jgi:hypothetical protein
MMEVFPAPEFLSNATLCSHFVRINGQLVNPISIRRYAGLWTVETIGGRIEGGSFAEFSE